MPNDDAWPELDRLGKRRRSRNVILALLGAFALCVLLCLGVLAWRVAVVGDADRQLAEGADQRESLDEKYAAVAAAFNSGSLDAGQEELRSIRRLFDAIIAATVAGNNPRFAREVDVDRHFAEMIRSGAMRAPPFYKKRFAVWWVRQTLYVPMDWSRYELVHVELRAGGTEAVVYAYFWVQDNAETKVRWWIVRGDQGWKAYDWDVLDYGVRASRENAILYANDGDPRLERYYQCKRQLQAADRFMEQGDYEQAAQTIRNTETLEVLPVMRDDAWLQIGNAWSRCGRVHEALTCYRRIKNPDALPGALYGQALTYSDRGQHQKALEFASRYEALLGRSPGVNGMKGESLLALGRVGEAVAELRKSLDVNPDQLDVLQWLGLALDDDQKDILAEYVAKAKDPAETVESLGRSFGIYDDSAAVEALARLVARIAPGSPTVSYLAGLAKEIDEDYLGAAELFKQASTEESDPDKKEQYVRRYLDAMISADQPAEGYLGAPDPLQAFEYLAGWYMSEEYEIPEQALARVLQEHRRKYPDDPWGHYYQGVLYGQQEKYDEAEKELAAGMDKTTDEEVLDPLRYQLVWVLYKAGRGMEAYRKFGHDEETFRLLAAYYEEATSSDQIAQLKALVQAHRAEHPDDEWLDYYAALVKQHEKDYDEADRLLARGYRRASEQHVKSAYHAKRLDARVESGRLLAALEEIEPPDETFAGLAQRLNSPWQRPQLERLVERYRQINASSPQLRHWEVELLWRRRDHQGVIGRLTPWPKEALRQLSPWQVSALREKLVRSYLRLNRSSAAMAAARGAYEEHGDVFPMILVYASQGKVEETSQYMGEYLLSQYLTTHPYYDEDVGRILRGRDFLSLRQQYPPSVPYGTTGTTVVLLLKEPRTLDADQLGRLLAPVMGADLTATTLPADPKTDGTTSFIVHVQGQVYCVSHGTDRYQPGDESYVEPVRGERLKQAIADQNAWLAVDALASNTIDEGTEFSTVCRLAAALLDADPLAAYFPDYSRLIPADAAIRDALASGQPPEKLLENGETVWLYRGTADEDGEEQPVEKRPRFKELRAAFARRGEQELLIRVDVHVGHASEPQWLRVERIDGGPRRPNRLIAQFIADSLLVPEFRRGEPLAVRPFEILEWKYSDAGAPGRDDVETDSPTPRSQPKQTDRSQ